MRNYPVPAFSYVDHDEFKMGPLAQRRCLDVIGARGNWQNMPARTWRYDNEREPRPGAGR
jgi:hypothetical protein